MAPRREITPLDQRVTALGVIAPVPIVVESPKFSGSLATLFQCVRTRKVELLDVPLAPICEAYFRYILDSPARDLDEAAAGLAALAYLLERKAWLLLPVDEPEPEMDDDAPLLEPSTHLFAQAIEALRLFEDERSRKFFRPPDSGPDPYELPFVLGNASANDLARAFQRLLARAEPDPIQPMAKPKRSLAEQMRAVLASLSNEWRSLEDTIAEPFTRLDAVFWFLAMLELIRLGQAAVKVQDDVAFFARSGAV